MAQLDALRLTETLRTRLVDFAVDDAHVRDRRLTEICRRLWSGLARDGGLLSDLWVEGAFPAANSEWTLDRLVGENRFDAALANQLDTRRAVPRHRPLYTHQEESIAAAQQRGPCGERPALVVTAGTGAGKTESFLLPILDDLYRYDPGTASGMRCLILYPMNALVNDQVDRLYGWLQGQDRMSLFHFTGDTPEDKRAADRDGVPMWDACRPRTRQEARGLATPDGRPIEPADRRRVPDIVVTNYSMLEYMLCRPQDTVFFGPSLRAIVLDEAHLYTGTLAAEITLLLRRVLARCGLKPTDLLQIATSATLGSGNDEELRNFAGTVFSKSADNVHVITGRMAPMELAEEAPPEAELSAAQVVVRPWIDRPLVVAGPDGQEVLSRDPELAGALRARLAELVAPRLAEQHPSEDCPAVVLATSLPASPVVHTLAKALWEHRRLPLPELARLLWGEQEQAIPATVALLQLTASARRHVGDYPLVPHRIHFLARPSDGLTVCLDAACSGAEAEKLHPFGTVATGSSDRCACGGATLSLVRCGNCGGWMVAGDLDGNRLRPVAWSLTRARFFTDQAGAAGTAVTLNPQTGEWSGANGTGVRLTNVEACTSCGAGRDDIRLFESGPPLALSIVAETVLAELPEYAGKDRAWLPARGRRLLAFSDSRSEAARLGPRLTRQHEVQVVRAAISNALHQRLAGDDATIETVRQTLEQFRNNASLPSNTPAQRQFFETQARAFEQQLVGYQVGGSMKDWQETLARQPVLGEIMDGDAGSTHRAGAWGQRAWDENTRRVKIRAFNFLAREFASPIRRAASAETLGLAEVTYPGLAALAVPQALLGAVPTEITRNALRSCWTDFLAALCDTLRSEGVVTTLDDAEDRAYQFGAMFIGRWVAERDERRNALVRFVGATPRQRRRAFTAAVLQAAGMSATEAEDWAERVLSAAFAALHAAALPVGQDAAPGQLAWLQTSIQQTRNGPPSGALRVVFAELGLRRPPSLYRCNVTGLVWCRSVLGCAPADGCNQTLAPTSDAELDQDPRVGRQRREYQTSPVFRIGLWAEEHSAQLSAQETRRLQDLFKVGARNVLSATTTLELGIDIGGLNAVLMGNVPPGKANYLQRAGRAGRRADGSSAVISFARPQPFDREVFQRIGDYLDRPLRRPVVFLDRERVVRRHLHSFLVGEFFRGTYAPDHRVGAMSAFGNMGSFCGVALPERWERGVGKPSVAQPPPIHAQTPTLPVWWSPALQATGLEAQFLSFLYWVRDWGEHAYRAVLEEMFARTVLAPALDDWPTFFREVVEQFVAAVQSWRSEYDSLLLSWYVTDDRPQANAIRYQLSSQYELTVIEALADRQFLPHYGFPIGVHKLRVIAPDARRPGRVREEDQYRLERGSLLALREYVPGSQLLVGGKLVSSHGLLKHWTGASIDTYIGLRGLSCQCGNGHFYYWIAEAPAACPVCGEAGAANPGQLLFPKHGFSGAAWDPPKWSTDVERVGKAQTATMTFSQPASNTRGQMDVDSFGGVRGLVARYREAGELLVYNRGDDEHGFAICLKCGYADSERKVGQGRMDLPGGFERHAPLSSISPWRACWSDGTSPVLRNQTLAARETTDVMLIDFSACSGGHGYDERVVTTLAYALQRAGAQLQQLDARELGVLIVPTGTAGAGFGAVLYDSTPGGAGHTRELLDLGQKWLMEARAMLHVDDEHNTQCDTACLDCLLSFDAQSAMQRNLFVRPLALAWLDALLEGNSVPASPQTTLASEAWVDPLAVRSNDERRQAAQERRQQGTP